MAIHPTAIIHKGAEIDPTCEVGPFCVIGPRVKIGRETRLISHVVVDNETTIGARNIIHPFVSLGGVPQDLKFKGEPARVIIGDENVFREYVTVNMGTAGGHMETRIGSRGLFMACTHVAHDCVVGDGVVLANSAALAGHVTLEDNVRMGGMAGIHQFARVGYAAFIGAGAMVAQDIPPYCIAEGDRATLAGLNVVGLKRSGWSRERIGAMREAFKMIFYPEGTRAQGIERAERELAPKSQDVAQMMAFIRGTKRGVASARPRGDSDTDET
jgi:UDP-N-acetylglucosamine acyltransferase